LYGFIYIYIVVVVVIVIVQKRDNIGEKVHVGDDDLYKSDDQTMQAGDILQKVMFLQ
jgi:hypothetical protein